MNYPMDLIKAYRNKKITRVELCRRLAELQGHNGIVKAYAKDSFFISYRGRTAILRDGGVFVWDEAGKTETAATIKEMKIKIDIAEIKAAA